MTEKNSKKIYQKLIDFQKISSKIFKKKENSYLTKKVGYKVMYADLADILESIKPALLEVGLGYTQILAENGLRTIVFTADGEEIEAFYPIIYTSAQDTGSLISYARKYSLISILGLIVDGDDDDGNEASKEDKNSKTTTTHPSPALSLTVLEGEVNRLINTASAISGTDPNKMLAFYLDKLKVKNISELKEPALKSLISALYKQIDKHTDKN